MPRQKCAVAADMHLRHKPAVNLVFTNLEGRPVAVLQPVLAILTDERVVVGIRARYSGMARGVVGE